MVGGGPAGVMLSYLLARAGTPVTLLEAHHDFDRDFRGDTIHPSTLEALDALTPEEPATALVCAGPALPSAPSPSFDRAAGPPEFSDVTSYTLSRHWPS